MGDRWKRVFAFVIDWNISLFPFMAAIFGILIPFQGAEVPLTVVLLVIVLMLIPLGLFGFRDFLCRGRSLGKRLMGLHIYDSRTLKEVEPKQCGCRNLFFFLYFVDGILLLATGKTIGDRAADTVVLSRESRRVYQQEQKRPISGKKQARQLAWILAIVLVCVLAFVGFIQIILNGQKDTEECRLAQEYLLASEAFAQLNADASKIRMNSYSASTSIPKDGDSPVRTVRIGFLISMQSYEVVCHRENGIWRVCEECTMFD